MPPASPTPPTFATCPPRSPSPLHSSITLTLPCACATHPLSSRVTCPLIHSNGWPQTLQTPTRPTRRSRLVPLPARRSPLDQTGATPLKSFRAKRSSPSSAAGWRLACPSARQVTCFRRPCNPPLLRSTTRFPLPGWEGSSCRQIAACCHLHPATVARNYR